MTADLDVPLSCPNATAKAAFARAVKRGTITWHAGPMNMQVRAVQCTVQLYTVQFGTMAALIIV
jgi:hypothetical protein